MLFNFLLVTNVKVMKECLSDVFEGICLLTVMRMVVFTNALRA